LDFGKSARLVCQQTCGESKKIGVSARKFQGVIPPKKKNFCVLCLKLANFFMSAPPNWGCWNTRQYNARLHETNQEEERKNQEINIIGMTLSHHKEATRVVLLLTVVMLDW
jgi:hypothetical protein